MGVGIEATRKKAGQDMKIKREKLFVIPRFGEPPGHDVKMGEVEKDEIITVLAWRIRALEEQVAEIRDAERVS